MNIRLKTLWRVPVFCLIADWIASGLAVLLSRFLYYTVTTTRADGVVTTFTLADPVRNAIWLTAVFALALLIGGLLFFRSMTKAEIALSAAIIVAFYLILNILRQTFFTFFPPSFGLTLAKLQNWSGIISFSIYKVTHQLALSTIISCFAPFLFVPFGKRAVRQGNPESNIEL